MLLLIGAYLCTMVVDQELGQPTLLGFDFLLNPLVGGGGVGVDGGIEEEWEGRWEKEFTSCLKVLVNSRMFFNFWSCALASSSSRLINSAPTRSNKVKQVRLGQSNEKQAK